MNGAHETEGHYIAHETTHNPQVSGNMSEQKQTSQGEQAQAQPPKPRRPRGFAAMDRKLVSEIARKGGKAAHSAGTAHEFTTEEARVAGRKGGRATHAKRRAQSEPPVARSEQNESGGPSSH